jgi:hypothetical protein
MRREVNPTIFTPTQFRQRLKQKDAFVDQVWRGKKLWLIGNEEKAKP